MKLSKVKIESIHLAPPLYEEEAIDYVVRIEIEIASEGMKQPEHVKFVAQLPYDPERSTRQIVVDALSRARLLAGAASLASEEEWNRLQVEELTKPGTL